MAKTPRFVTFNPWHLAGIAAVALVFGTVLQLLLSASGRSPLVPPYSMALALAALSAVILAFGLRLKHDLKKGSGAVNPFHAVRLLATARAGQLVAALFSGLGAGLLLSLLWRSLPAPIGTWAPMLACTVAAVALLIAALITERLCRLPRDDDGENSGQGVRMEA